MRIAIVYPYYQGHGAPGHSSVYELAHFLAARGHEVRVVSGESGYMHQDAPMLPWYRRLMRKETDGAVSVIRTYSYSQRNRSYFGRLLGFISFSLSCPIGLLAVGAPDLVLASSPPIFPAFSTLLACRLRRIPFVIEVRDLWPASGVQMGLVRNRMLIGIMGWIERRLYDRARTIVALTEGIRGDICARGWPAGKVEVVTCGVDPDVLCPDAGAAASTRAAHGWQGRKVVLYFGALGEANNIPVIVRAAQRLRGQPGILLVLIGDGIRRADAERAKGDLALGNLQILPPVPKAHAREYINAADLCLVTLKDIPLFGGAIPTKLIDYMACARPVVCGVRGEARRIVEESGAGLVFEPDDDAGLAESVLELLRDEERMAAMGSRGLAFVRSRFSAARMREKMEQVLLAASEGHADRRWAG